MVRKFEFNPCNKVEVSIDRGGRGGIHGLWFTATIVRCISSDKFLVKYDHLNMSPTVVRVHQLRPVPPSVSDWKLNIGDKVEAFRKQRWWEGHVSEVVGSTGKLFSVRFTDSKEIIFSKEKLRVHRKWINHNWVPPITNQKLKNHYEEWRSNPISKKVQPPCFPRLKSLIVHKSLNVSLPVTVPNEDIIKVVAYMLQNTTPMPRVEIIGGNIYTTRNRRFSCRIPLPV